MKRISLPIAAVCFSTVFCLSSGQAQDAPSLTKKGIADYKAGKLDDAIKDFDDAIKLDPKDAGNFATAASSTAKREIPPKPWRATRRL